MASEEMSREEKEALLNIRMEEIRRKNAALKKRHEEIEADKKLAKSHLFRDASGGIVDKKQPAEPANRPKPQQPRVRHVELLSRSSFGPPEPEKKRAQRLSEDDGPPPDPSYRFLDDRARDNRNDSAPGQDRRRGSRRHPGNYGGQDFDNVKSTIQQRRTQDKSPRQPPQSKMEMALRMTGRERCEYEQWRSEQNRIERDRISRQKTTSGEWRREWDREKNFHNPDKNKDENASLQSRWGAIHRGGGIHGRIGNQQKTSSEWTFDSSRHYQKADETKTQFQDEPRVLDDLPSRHVNLKEDSINISISNDFVILKSTPTQCTAAPSTVLKGRASFSDEDDQRCIFNQSEPWQNPKVHSPIFPVEVQRKRQNPKVLGPIIPVEPWKVLQVEKGTAHRESDKLEAVPCPVVNLAEKSEETSDVPDDESWDDEGSWEDANTSGTESQDLSQPSAELEALPKMDLSKRKETFNLSGVDKEMLFATMDPLSLDASTSDTRETTPVVDFQKLASPENHKEVQDGQVVDQIKTGLLQQSEGNNIPDENAPLHLDHVAVQPDAKSCNTEVLEIGNVVIEYSSLHESQPMAHKMELQELLDCKSKEDGLSDGAVPTETVELTLVDDIETLALETCRERQNCPEVDPVKTGMTEQSQVNNVSDKDAPLQLDTFTFELGAQSCNMEVLEIGNVVIEHSSLHESQPMAHKMELQELLDCAKSKEDELSDGAVPAETVELTLVDDIETLALENHREGQNCPEIGPVKMGMTEQSQLNNVADKDAPLQLDTFTFELGAQFCSVVIEDSSLHQDQLTASETEIQELLDCAKSEEDGLSKGAMPEETVEKPLTKHCTETCQQAQDEGDKEGHGFH